MSNEDELARKLAALQEVYLADSPRRLAELWTAFAWVQNGDVGALADLGSGLHRLAGTGGSYGLMSVTETARAGEQATRALMDAGRPPTADECAILREHIQNLAAAFAAASNPE